MCLIVNQRVAPWECEGERRSWGEGGDGRGRDRERKGGREGEGVGVGGWEVSRGGWR